MATRYFCRGRQSELRGGRAALLHVDVGVEQIAKPTQRILRRVPAADRQRERQTLEDHPVVHTGRPVALQPDRHAVGFECADPLLDSAVLENLAAWRNAQRARRFMARVARHTARQRGRSTEQSVNVDPAPNQLVEAGNDSQRQAGVGIEGL